mgnify:CR=1 FL=1
MFGELGPRQLAQPANSSAFACSTSPLADLGASNLYRLLQIVGGAACPTGIVQVTGLHLSFRIGPPANPSYVNNLAVRCAAAASCIQAAPHACMGRETSMFLCHVTRSCLSPSPRPANLSPPTMP